MAGKHEYLIITELRGGDIPRQMVERIEEQRKKGIWMSSTHLLRLDNQVLQGALYTDCVWIWSKEGQSPLELEIAHTHDFDEVLGLIGCNPADPYDLGGTIEFWIEDEKYMLTRSCLIFVPRGIKHCPLLLHQVYRPIFFFTTGNSKIYDRVTGKEY